MTGNTPILIMLTVVFAVFLAVLVAVSALRIVRSRRRSREQASIEDDADLRVLRSLGEEVNDEEFDRVLAHTLRASNPSWEVDEPYVSNLARGVDLHRARDRRN